MSHLSTVESITNGNGRISSSNQPDTEEEECQTNTNDNGRQQGLETDHMEPDSTNNGSSYLSTETEDKDEKMECQDEVYQEPSLRHDSNNLELEHEDTEESMLQGNPMVTYPDAYHSNGTLRRTYKCWFCPFQSSCGLNIYLSHKEKHFKKSRFCCPNCTFSCNTLNGLKSHLSCHKGSRRKASNSFRSKRIYRRGALNLRTSNAHPAIPREVSRSTGSISVTKAKPYKNTYKCIYDNNCPAIFKFLSSMEAHKRRHTWNGRDQFSCDKCSYSVDKKIMLERHLQLHGPSEGPISDTTATMGPFNMKKVEITGSKMGTRWVYKCPDMKCPTRLCSKKELAVHLNLHNNPQAKFKCNICTYGVDAVCFLTRHLAIHQARQSVVINNTALGGGLSKKMNPKNLIGGVKPLRTIACGDINCPQKFIREIDRHNHMISHNGQQRYTCNKCTYSVDSWKSSHDHKRIHAEAEMTQTNFKNKIKARALGLKSGSARSLRPDFPQRSNLNNCKMRNLAWKGLPEDQKQIIIKGNPKFTYKTHRKSSTGKFVSTSYRCFFCPKSLASFGDWNSHQNLHKSDQQEKVYPKHYRSSATEVYECQMCDFKTTFKGNLVKHLKSPKHKIMCGNSHSSGSVNVNDRKQEVNHYSRSKSLFEQGPYTPALKPEVFPESEYAEENNLPGSANDFLIRSLEIRNIMLVAESRIEPGENLCCLQGGSDTGKTTTIVSVGLGYDILLDLPDNSTICGVDIESILRYGETHGFVELGLDINPYPELKSKYGPSLILRRHIKRCVPLSQSEIDISYKGVKEEKITRAQLKSIVGCIFPSFTLRLMVLNSENLQYLSEHFHICDEIFWKFAEQRRNDFMAKAKQRKTHIGNFEADLESRRLRISFLQNDLKQQFKDDSRIRQLRVVQAVELQEALDNFATVNDVYQQLLQEEASFNATFVDQLNELVRKMRIPFVKYLHCQNYVGDLILDDQELIIWVKDPNMISGSSEVTIQDARQIWKSLTIGRRKLAIIGLYFSFWHVLECCPLLLSDAYSSSDLEFKIPQSALPVLLGLIREEQRRQFFLSLPDTIPNVVV